MMSFQGQRVWITGASAGIGEALAKLFHQAGTKLILSARREDDLKRVQSECGGEASARVLPLDVTQTAELPEKARAALEMFGGIDILVNNAGVTQRSLVEDTKIEVYRKLMEVNFFGAVALTKEVLPSMVQNKHGHIVVISSLVGKFGTPLRSGYAAAKHALHGFFDSLRAEVNRHGIKVTLVCPGYIRTDVSLNALRGDGSPHAKMDSGQARGMSAEECAAQILKAVARGKEEVNVGGRDTYFVYLKRFFPGVLSRMVARS
ncbi:MAG TPA: SDR family oxidoreductase [Candidatus Angelobacter sp.]|nr:SDR family oxidoreductase [Candidatus Angelobacter sp.]